VELSRATRAQQYFFVNRRWVRSRLLAHALEEAYHTLLPLHRYPVAMLLLDLEPSLVDVNVHPTKAEVRFSCEGEIYQAFKRALHGALGEVGPSVSLRAGVEVAAGGVRPTVSAPLSAAPEQSGLLALSPSASLGVNSAEGLSVPRGTSRVAPAAAPAPHPALQPRPAGARAHFRPLAQLRGMYILAEGETGLLVVDQHRAHERLLYEQFMRNLEDQERQSQPLLAPATIHLGPRECAVLQESLEELRAFGFDLEEFGGDCFLLRAVPVAFLKQDPIRLLSEIVEDLAASPDAKIHSRREQALITMSCKAAIKAGDALAPEEMEELLRALSQASRPYTCPHGRPTVMTISNFELDRKFHR